ncbi:hypothetical protein [Acetobacterium bakii]|nr:hypothetical protein [Acetobacterium bakii]
MTNRPLACPIMQPTTIYHCPWDDFDAKPRAPGKALFFYEKIISSVL